MSMYLVITGFQQGYGSPSLTQLRDGTVLLAGGLDDYDPLASAELFDPMSIRWRPAATMHVGHSGHTATLLRDGTVLVAGGLGTVGPDAEMFLPNR
jgi:hypothetical protein